MLNLAATAFLLCAYTGRFVFPMLSLEGRKFWILGLLPLQRERLLWGKFMFSALGGLVIAEFLVLLSDVMLGLPWLVVALHALTVFVVAVGLSGLSVGMGAWIPNFQESDPSKIAAATGGTLNLIVGLLFILVVLGLMSLPWHLAAATNNEPKWYEFEAVGKLVPGVLAGIAVGVVAVLGPLWIGARALKQMEF
jgi:ABC-2 type transport system permease protein